MKKIKAIFVPLLVLMVLTVGAAWASPFAPDMGLSSDSLEYVEPDDGDASDGPDIGLLSEDDSEGDPGSAGDGYGKPPSESSGGISTSWIDQVIELILEVYGILP